MPFSSNFIPGSNSRLTDKDRIFAILFLTYGHGANAVIGAGFSENSANSYAQKLLNKKLVRDFMVAKIDEVLAKLQIGLEWSCTHIKTIVEDNVKNDPGTALNGINIFNKMMKVYAEDAETNKPNYKPVDKQILENRQKPY